MAARSAALNSTRGPLLTKPMEMSGSCAITAAILSRTLPIWNVSPTASASRARSLSSTHAVPRAGPPSAARSGPKGSSITLMLPRSG